MTNPIVLIQAPEIDPVSQETPPQETPVMIQKLALRPTVLALALATAALGSGNLAAQSAPTQADNLRFRTGLTSVANHQEVIVRVTELERSAGDSEVVLAIFDRRDRIVARRTGSVASGEAFEFTLQASRLGNDPRELFRVDLLLADRMTTSVPVIHVEIYDPFGLTVEEDIICNGRGASGNGPIGNCQGVVNFETP